MGTGLRGNGETQDRGEISGWHEHDEDSLKGSNALGAVATLLIRKNPPRSAKTPEGQSHGRSWYSTPSSNASFPLVLPLPIAARSVTPSVPEEVFCGFANRRVVLVAGELQLVVEPKIDRDCQCGESTTGVAAARMRATEPVPDEPTVGMDLGCHGQGRGGELVLASLEELVRDDPRWCRDLQGRKSRGQDASPRHRTRVEGRACTSVRNPSH
jgi:hypothetical protein